MFGFFCLELLAVCAKADGAINETDSNPINIGFRNIEVSRILSFYLIGKSIPISSYWYKYLINKDTLIDKCFDQGERA